MEYLLNFVMYITEFERKTRYTWLLMTCPKYNDGALVTVTVKKTGEEASFCDCCETIWFRDEQIRKNTGRPVEDLWN